jgi:TonB family protein
MKVQIITGAGMFLLATGTSVSAKSDRLIARPMGNQTLWVTPEDYPREALRQRAEGVTRFTVDVGKNGRVSKCRIIGSSGFRALDAATCKLISDRARFFQTRDSRGHPAAGTYSNSVRWVAPSGDLPPADQVKLIDPHAL